MPKRLFLEKTPGNLMGVRTEGFGLTEDERKSLHLELTHTWHKSVIDMFNRQGRPRESFDLGVKTLSTKIQALDGVDFETKARIDATDPRQYELYMTWLPPRGRVESPTPGPGVKSTSLLAIEPTTLPPRERHCLGCVDEEMERMERQSPGVTRALTLLAHLALAQAASACVTLGGAEIYRYAARGIARGIRRPASPGSPDGEAETPPPAEIASVLMKTEAFGLWLSIYRRHLPEDGAD